jgi:hypothetical protein
LVVSVDLVEDGIVDELMECRQARTRVDVDASCFVAASLHFVAPVVLFLGYLGCRVAELPHSMVFGECTVSRVSRARIMHTVMVFGLPLQR